MVFCQTSTSPSGFDEGITLVDEAGAGVEECGRVARAGIAWFVVLPLPNALPIVASTNSCCCRGEQPPRRMSR